MREFLTLEEFFRLLPDLEELEGLRASVVGAAVPEPGKEWASSSAYTTIDKRVISRDVLEQTLTSSEEALHQQIRSTFQKLGEGIDHYWAHDEAATALDLVALGEAEEMRSRPGRARTLHQTALQLTLPLADKRPQILTLRRVARVLWHQGELNEAREYYARSAELAGAAGDLRGRVIACTGVGNVLLFQGRWAEAESAYRAALQILTGAEAQNLHLERGQIYNNLGSCTMRLGRSDEAEEWLGHARELWQLVDSPTDLAVCYHNLGLLRMEHGRYADAREVLLSALDLPVSPSLRSVIATDLSDVFLRDGLLSQAEIWGREAETQAIASRSPYHLSHMYRGLGNIARARGDGGGITFFEKAVEIARENGQWIAEGETLVDYAQLRAMLSDIDEALSYLDRARQIFEQLGAVHEVARADRVAAEIRPLPLAAAGD